jgi:hypothetical protein
MSSLIFSQLFSMSMMPALFAIPGVPLGVPADADPLLGRVAPEECVFYMVNHGVAAPDSANSNLTEKLFAEPEVRRMATMVQNALANQAASQLDPESAELAQQLQTAVLTKPMAVCVEKLEFPPL